MDGIWYAKIAQRLGSFGWKAARARVGSKLTKITKGVGKTIFVKFQAHIVFCFGVFGVFVCFSGADFIFYDFAFSVSRHLWRRKM